MLLLPGNHSVKVVFDTGWVDLNYVRVINATTPYLGTPIPVPGTIEAENFDNGSEGLAYHDTTAGNALGQYRQTDVDIGTTSDTGGGYSVGWTSAGEWLGYGIAVASDGSYDVGIRAARRLHGTAAFRRTLANINMHAAHFNYARV